MKITSKVVDMTPSMATELLARNTHNRPARATHITKLAGAMRRGEWSCNGDAIRVTAEGLLADGQHRLKAIVESGVTVRTVLVTGLAPDAFATIDRGLCRTTADTLALSGEADATKLAAISRLMHIYLATGSPFRHGAANPTAQQQIALLAEHPGMRDSARWVSTSRWCRTFITPSLVGFCHYVFNTKDPVSSATFFSSLESGVGLEAGSPILLLRDRMTDVASSKTRIDNTYKTALIFKAFKLHRLGASIKTLRVRTEGDSVEKDIFVL